MESDNPAEWIRTVTGAPGHRLDDARSCFSQALNLSGASGDKLQTAQAHSGLGQIERDRRNIWAALKHYQLPLTLRKQDNPLALAHTIRMWQTFFSAKRISTRRGHHYEEALAILSRSRRDPPLEPGPTHSGVTACSWKVRPHRRGHHAVA